MKKIFYALFTLILVLLVISANKGSAVIDRTSFYECPSMKQYSPMMNVGKFCQKQNKVRPSEMKSCEEEYKKIYGEAEKEFKNKLCKVNTEAKFTSTVRGTATCSVEYKLEPPTITSYKVSSMTAGKVKEAEKKSIEDALATEELDASKKTSKNDEMKCLKALEKALKAKYPNLVNEQF